MTAALAVAGLWAMVTMAAGGALTRLAPWYFALEKPPWQPPGWLFAPAWAVIMALAAGAAAIGWTRAATAGERGLIVALFLLNGALNILWSGLFFNRRRPDWALAEVPLLWLSILAPMVALWPIAPVASLLLLPYALWVAFAAILNRDIVRRNAPFAGKVSDSSNG